MAVRLPRWIRRLLAPFRWSARDDDMDREMAFHVESLAGEYERSGMPRTDAERAARRRFGDIGRLKERGHDERTSAFLASLVRDIRYVGRASGRSPGFALAVGLTLAVGIGGNTAIFSVVDQLLLRPLPYPRGDRLVNVQESIAAMTVDVNSVSPANWLDWQRESRTLTGLAAWRTVTYTLTGVGDPLRVDGQIVSAEFFPVLGVEPRLGRTITPDDDRPGAPQVIVLSYDLWQRRFGGDASVIGRVAQVNDQPMQIVGVMPAGFHFVYPDTDIWTAYRLDRSLPWRDRAGRFMNVVARLDPASTLEAARAELATIAQRLAATYEFNRNTTVRLVPLREQLTGQVSAALLGLYGAVGVLLAIACFNVASLLLARAASRRREIAIRASLGAGRLAIVQQLLVESLLLALAGGLAGILLARLALDALVAVAPADLLRVPALSVDRRVLLYALGLSLSTGLVVGLVPALVVARRPLVEALRTSSTGVAHSPWLRQGLVAGQVALTVILLCGAGLLVQTVVGLNRTDGGVDRHDLLTLEVALPLARYPEDRRVAFYNELVESLRALPGVTSAAAADSLAVIGMPRGGTVFHQLGTPERPLSERPMVTIRVVTPGYFRTLGIPVLRGREFSLSDNANPQAGFVVNEAFARAHLAGQDPLAHSLSVMMTSRNPHMPIVGVVGDVREGSIRDGAQPTVFYNHRALPESSMTLFVRSRRAASLAQAAEAAVRTIDANLAVTRVRTFEQALAESLARERLSAVVSGTFALSGLLLSALGLYGLLAFQVTERTKEIAIRIALGARLSRLAGSVVGRGLRLVAVGAVIGVGGSLLLLQYFGPLLFGVTPYDPFTYATVLALLGAVAALACYIPARRAARLEPLVALRQE